jgi:hypothetical protein
MAATSLEYALRDNGKTDSSVKVIDGEIVAVHGEDPTDAFSFSNSDECRIREVHRSVGIFNHELSYARYIYQAERHVALLLAPASPTELLGV